MPIRPTDTEVRQTTSLTHRVSIGLISISLSLMSLALGLTLLTLPLPTSVFIATPPSAQSVPSSATAVTLNWTAPGDDGNIGRAASYNLRFSTSPITDGNFSQATAVTTVPPPSPAGSTEAMTIIGLQPATTYFFALKTTDAAGNVSALSNVASKTTASLPAACVPTYACSEFSACSSTGQQTRTCTVSNGCDSRVDEPVTTQACTPPATTTASEAVPAVHLTSHIIAVAAAPGTNPIFRIIDPKTHKVFRQVLAFNIRDRHGVNVAVGDLDGDHVPDVAAGTGAGTDAQVKLFSKTGQELAHFNPYSTSRRTGVAVAVADINGDGKDELLTIPATGTSQLRAFQYNPETKKFTALAQTFVYNKRETNGFTLATGDLNNDGRADVVVAPRTRGRSVTVMTLEGENNLRRLSSFRPYPTLFRSGLTVTVGDINGDGRQDIMTAAGPGYYTDVRVFDYQGHMLTSFRPTSRTYLGGITMSTLDVNSDGVDELITGTYQNGLPGLRYYHYSGLTKRFSQIASYYAYKTGLRVGLRLSSK